MTHVHTYTLRDDYGVQELEAPSDEAAIQAARAILSQDRRDDRSATAWVTADLCRPTEAEDEDDELIECIEIELSAQVPQCAGGSPDQHVWREVPPSPIGHGGGVVVTEGCAWCGAERVTVTWARGPHGEEGYRQERYRPEGTVELERTREGSALRELMRLGHHAGIVIDTDQLGDFADCEDTQADVRRCVDALADELGVSIMTTDEQPPKPQWYERFRWLEPPTPLHAEADEEIEAAISKVLDTVAR